jgi:hypothetical protein
MPEDIHERLQQAGLKDVKMGVSGQLLDSQYFLNLLQFVGETTKLGMEENLKVLVAERREAYKNKDDELYEQIIKK